MSDFSRFVYVCPAVAALLTLFTISPALALDGNNAPNLTALNGWSTFELVTQNDNISAFSDAGYGATASRGIYDGLGGYLDGETLRIYLNHETSAAAISRVELDLGDFKQSIASTIDGGVTAFPTSIVTGMGYAYDTIYDGSYHAINNPNPVASGTVAVGTYGNANFARFCSGTRHFADEFGPDRGLVDDMYLTGEEVAGGLFYAIDAATNTMWEVPDLGLGNWENAAQVDTGNDTHVALLLSPDVGFGSGETLRLYVGEKGVDANGDGEIDFLERNGMRGGTVHFFDPDGAASTTDLPDGSVDGTWNTSNAQALRETKLEDVATNPHDGTQVVLGATNDGVYVMDFDLVFNAGVFDGNASSTTITQIDDDDVLPVRAPDNLDWGGDNKIYVQEDGDGDDMWEMNPDGTGLVQIASAFSEPSGIVDISDLVGYEDGSVLLTSIQGFTSSGAQLSVLVSPDAALLTIPGDADCDGDVDLDDFNILAASFGQTTTTGKAVGDFDNDGDTDLDDFNILAANFGASSETVASSLPEPGSAALLTVVVFAFNRRQHY